MSSVKKTRPTQAPGAIEQPEARDVEVLARPTRRTFTAEYKASILAQAEACGPGEVGALLRREGLYTSTLSKWRKQRDRGAAAGLAPKTRGRKSKQRDDLSVEIERLRRQNASLTEELRKAHVIIDVQKKVAMLLGVPVETPPNEGRS